MGLVANQLQHAGPGQPQAPDAALPAIEVAVEGTQGLRGLGAPEVLALGDGLQVPGVAAPAVPTQVVEGLALGDGATEVLVAPAVGAPPVAAPGFDHPVVAAVGVAYPEPAQAHGVAPDARPEDLQIGHDFFFEGDQAMVNSGVTWKWRPTWPRSSSQWKGLRLGLALLMCQPQRSLRQLFRHP